MRGHIAKKYSPSIRLVIISVVSERLRYAHVHASLIKYQLKYIGGDIQKTVYKAVLMTIFVYIFDLRKRLYKIFGVILWIRPTLITANAN